MNLEPIYAGIITPIIRNVTGWLSQAIKDGEIKKQYQRDNIIYKSDWQCMYCGHRSLCWRDKLDG